MPSVADELLEDGALTLDDTHGESIVYKRGSDSSDPFVATWSDHTYETAGTDGSPVSFLSRDFVFVKPILIIDGEVKTPRKRDRIVLGSEEFEVLPVGDMKPAVEELQGGFRWLVHTKRVETSE
jgi:hypothetical protein